MKDLFIYGAGGFGREIACLIGKLNEQELKWNFLGFIDDGLPVGSQNRFGDVLGDISYLNEYHTPIDVVIAIANPMLRKLIHSRVTNPNVEWPNIIAPDVLLFDNKPLLIGKGNILFYSCRVSIDVRIGDFNLCNSLVSFGHDVQVGDYNVMMPNTRISGDSWIGSENFFGVNSLVLQGKKIGNNTRIGTNSVVMRDTKDGFLYFGNPAKKMNL
ncbi:MAG: acetyltransferase [Bacteroidales bacterium]